MTRCLLILIAGGLWLGPRVAEAASELGSNPPKVHLNLSGRVTLSGIAPLPLDELPPGTYRLRAQGLGTAFARGTLIRQPGSVSVESTAGASSLLWPPGLRHLEQQETGRGLILLGGGIGSGTMAIVNETSRSNAAQDVEDAQRIYDQAVSEEDILSARLELEFAQDEELKEQKMRNYWGTYLGLLWIGAAAEMWLLTPRPTLEDGPALQIPQATGAAAGLRSLFVPGSGQRFLGHSNRGNLFSIGFLGMGAVTLVAHEAYLQAYMEQSDAQRRYDTARTSDEIEFWARELDDASGKVDSRNTLRWVMAGTTAGIYVWNVLDAWLLGNAIQRAAPINMSIVPEAGGFQAALTWRIS